MDGNRRLHRQRSPSRENIEMFNIESLILASGTFGNKKAPGTPVKVKGEFRALYLLDVHNKSLKKGHVFNS